MTAWRDHVNALLLYILCAPVIFSTVERMIFITRTPEDLNWVDQRYADHPWITALHLVPGLLFFLLGPLQFHAGIRQVRLFHRTSGFSFIITGIVSSFGVMWMVIAFPAVGGLLTQAVTFALTLAMILLMGIAWRAIRNRNIQAHRKAMIRAFALGLTVSTARVFIEIAHYMFGIGFEERFTVCSALALVVNVAATERLVLPRLHDRISHFNTSA